MSDTPGRSLSAGMVAVVTASELAPIMMVTLNFSTPLYLWSGYGNLVYASTTYIGYGTLGSISQVDETTDLAARGITMQLSGVPTALVAAALTEDYQGRTCSVMFGALDTSAGLISSPITIFSGRMDVMAINDDGQTTNIAMTAENRLVDFRRAREVRYTHEEQAQLTASATIADLGMEFVTAIQEKAIYWGNPNTSAGGINSPPQVQGPEALN
jgi:hypothetical protein